MPTVRVRNITIVRTLIEVLGGHGYENKSLVWSPSQTTPKFSISYDNDHLIDVVINRPTDLSEFIEMTIENIAGINIDKLFAILNDLEGRLDFLEFTFIV